VILQDAFTVEPWNLRETQLDLDLLAQTDSLFALANGHLGWRANLDDACGSPQPHMVSWSGALRWAVAPGSGAGYAPLRARAEDGVPSGFRRAGVRSVTMRCQPPSRS
jgi:hypothetical protein